MQAANLELDEAVDVRQESGRIVITPLRRKEYDLAQLLKGITRRNLHGEVSFGDPVAKEPGSGATVSPRSRRYRGVLSADTL